MKRIAVYPGTFDPVTNGHIDLVERSLRIFDEVIVGIAANPKKQPLFSLDERISMFKDATSRFKHLMIETVFMMPSEEYSFITATIVKEVASYGGDVSSLVPKVVVERLKKKFAK